VFIDLLKPRFWKNVFDHGVYMYVLTATDEALFYLGGSHGRRRVCYVRTNKTDLNKLKFVKRDAFALGFTLWAGVCYYRKTSLFFIIKGVKVNAIHYIDWVLKPFLKIDIFPGRKNDFLFHQNSASGHIAKMTTYFLNNLQNVLHNTCRNNTNMPRCSYHWI
jgi:hypothetical protein